MKIRLVSFSKLTLISSLKCIFIIFLCLFNQILYNLLSIQFHFFIFLKVSLKEKNIFKQKRK
jgi:hypothetical protein